MLTEQNGIQVDKFYPPTDWQYSFPEGYTRLEYLESTGTQYIDTGVVPSEDLGFQITFLTNNSMTSTDNQFGCIMGGRYSSGNNDLQLSTFRPWKTQNLGTFRYGYNEGNGPSYSAGITLNQIQTVSFHYPYYINPNGVQITITSYSWTANAREIYLFGLNNNGTFVQSGNGCRIYSCIFYDDTNNIILRNYVPVKRNSDGVLGMLDLANTNGSDNYVFYTNANTSNTTPFIAGPELYSNNSQIDIRQKNNTNFVEKYKFNENNELVWANPQLNLSGPVGYTKVGNVTIQDGVSSNFSSSDYLLTSSSLISNNFKGKIRAKLNLGNSGWAGITHMGTSTKHFTIENQGTTQIRIYYYNKQTASHTPINFWNRSQINGNYVDYYFEYDKNNNQLIFKVMDLQGNNVVAEQTYNNVEFPDSTPIKLGYVWQAFNGEIDLKETYIKVNDKLWFYGKNYTSENYAPVPAGLNYNNTTTPSIGYVNTQTQVFIPAPTDGIKYSQTRDIKVIPPEDNTITLLYGTDEIHYLPSEYRELKGVNFTGSQSIDTGFKPNQNTRVLIKFNINGGYNSQGILGCDYFRLSRNGSTSLSDIYGTQNNNLTSFSINKDYVIDKNKNKTIINNSVFNTYTEETFQANENLVIGTYSSNWFYGCLYYCKVWDNGTLIKEFIPCERKSDNVTGMYDTVQGVFYEVNSTFVELKYKLFGLLAQVSSGTYDVYIDDVLYATTASGTQTDIDFSALGAEYVSIGTCTTPEELVLHKIVIKPTTSGETITGFKCARTSGASGNQAQGCLWVHLELENMITLNALLYTHQVYTNDKCMSITAQNNTIFLNSFNNNITGAVNVEYVPIFDGSKRVNNINYLFLISSQKLKRLIINNNNTNRYGFSELLRDNKVCEQITGKYSNYILGQRTYSNNYKLRILPEINKVSSSTTITSSINLSNLYPTKIDLSTTNDRTQVLLNGSSSYPMRGLRGLKVSNEAPFTGTSPQINVSYTGLDRDALVELFNSLPKVTNGQLITTTAATGNNLTKVGNVVIDENGVASGFTASNYLRFSGELPNFNKDFEITTKFNYTTVANNSLFGWVNSGYVAYLIITSTKKVNLYIRNNSTTISFTGTYSYEPNINYYIKFIRKGNKLAFYYSTDGLNYILDKEQSYDNLITFTIQNYFRIGVDGTNTPSRPFNGSIDLENTYIKVDNNYIMKGYLTDNDRLIATNKGWGITG